jgi:DNA-binding transcriptional ArsR family regulator
MHLLLADDPPCVSELAERVAVGDSAVSHSLRLLRAHGVVRAERSGTSMYYRLVDEHVRVLLTATAQHLDQEHSQR